MTSPFNQVLLRQMGGATARVAPGATAFAFRDAAQLLTVVGAWTPGDDPAPQVAWARDLWAAMRRVSSGGAYVNQLDADESTDRVREAYGVPTWASLVALKTSSRPDERVPAQPERASRSGQVAARRVRLRSSRARSRWSCSSPGPAGPGQQQLLQTDTVSG